MMMPFIRASLLSIILLLAPALSSGFIAPNNSASARRSLACKSTSGIVRTTTTTTTLSATRRNFFEQSTIFAATTILSTATIPLPAHAKEAPAVPITRQLVTETFDAIRDELSSPTGVVSTLNSLILEGSFEEIIQYTRESDAYFRKAKLGKARKLLTNKELKGEAVLMSNAVTFDLIGINRASRPGKENREEQLKYLGELKNDIEKFLELEGTIVVEE